MLNYFPNVFQNKIKQNYTTSTLKNAKRSKIMNIFVEKYSNNKNIKNKTRKNR